MNGMLYSAARCAAQVLGRACICAVFISLVACGGGSSGGGRGPDDPMPPPPMGGPMTPEAPVPPSPAPPPDDPGAPPATELSLNVQTAKTFSFSWRASAGATEYRLLETIDNIKFEQVATIPGDMFSFNLQVFLPSRMNARYFLQSCNAANQCASSVAVNVTRENITQAIGYIKPSNTELDPAGTPPVPLIDVNNDVLDLSADGNTLAFGVFNEDGLGAGVNAAETLGDRTNNSGAVYVLVKDKDNGVWRQQAYLKAMNSGPNLNFGMSVSLSADGNTLAVGAIEQTIGVDGATFDNKRGAVYIFTREGTTWSPQDPIRVLNGDPNDRFGITVSLADDGNTVAIGADGESGRAPMDGANGTNTSDAEMDNSVSNSGAAYIFVRNGTVWDQQAYLKASNAGVEDRFGSAIALSGDGQTLVVGASTESSPFGNPASDDAPLSGAAYVFVRSGTGWVQQALLKGDTNGNGEVRTLDLFGGSLSLSKDGRTLAVGANQVFFTATPPGPGDVYIFVRNDSNQWIQFPPLRAPRFDTGDMFGSVSLTDDGNTLLVGAPRESSAAKGILQGVNADSGAVDNSELRSGAAYLFSRTGAGWVFQTYIKAPNTEEGDDFGAAVAISGNGSTLAVMAPNEDSSATGVGGDQNDNRATIGGGAVYLY